MKPESDVLKFLFIVNPGSGSNEEDYNTLISSYFSSSHHNFEIHDLPYDCDLEELKKIILDSGADRVVAVGGDGTVKLVASCLLKTETPIGIIPAGSANGMAKELGIPVNIKEAIDVAVNGHAEKIHVVMVNDELCIHLADIGFNAFIVKKFDDLPQRGMLGYAKAAWHAIWNHRKMDVELNIQGEVIRSKAAMVVVANATMYGTGVKINPEGRLDDNVFEVILVKKYSVLEILKSKFTNLPFNPETIETFSTGDLKIRTKHNVHFQVDGEYMGKVKEVNASIIPAAINIIVDYNTP
jgi:diacylglycerol kinase (ATP)